MTALEFEARIQALHATYDEEPNTPTFYLQALDMARLMQRTQRGSQAYFNFHSQLMESNRERDYNALQAEVDNVVRLLCFLLGHDFECDVDEDCRTDEESERMLLPLPGQLLR